MNREVPAKKPKKPNILVRLLILLITAVLVAGALLLVIYRDRLNLDAFKRYLAYRSLETSDTGQAAPFTHAGGNQLSFAYLDSGILLSSSAGAHYYSFSGDSYAEEVLAMEHPVLSASSTSGVVYDAGGQSLFLFRDGKETFQLSLEGGGDLLSARVNSSGWLAVTAQQSGFKGVVTVYNASGNEVIQISLSSTFIIDAILSPDCRTVAVITMNQSGVTFQSEVLFYPVNQEEPSAQASLGSIMVLDLDYENGCLWVLGEDRLMTVSDDGQESFSYTFGRSYLKGCSLGGDGFALLLLGSYRAGSANQAITLDQEGQVIAQTSLSNQILDFDSAGNYCSLLSGSSLTIYTSELREYAELESTLGARYTAQSANGSALLADSQQAWLYIPN